MFRFTIRDVLWLTVVVGLAVGWWLDNKRIETEVFKLSSERRAIKAEFDDRLKAMSEMSARLFGQP